MGFYCFMLGDKMFHCDKCGKISQPKEKCNIVPVKTRTKHYNNGTVGIETVQEQKLCKECQNG